MTRKEKNVKTNEKDEYNFVLYVPEIIHKNWKINENGKVMLIFDVTNPITKFAGWLLKKEPKRDLEFDELSSSAWLSIDGEKSIFEIARMQKSITNDSFKNALIRLIEFMHYVAKRRWIKYKRVKSKLEIDNTNK